MPVSGQSKDLLYVSALWEQNNDHVRSTFHKKVEIGSFEKKLSGSIGRQSNHQDSLQTVARLRRQSTVIGTQYMSLTLFFHFLTQKQHCEHVLAALEETMI